MNAGNDVYLDGLEKVSVLMICLGTDLAAEVCRHLSPEEIEKISRGILRWKQVPSHVRAGVLEEFREIRMARDYIAEGGLEYAQRLLERALGPQRAGTLIRRLTASSQAPPFESLRNSDPAQLFQFIQNEHPQTIALVLAHLPPDLSAMVLTGLPPEVQADVAMRIVTMTRTAPEVIEEVEQVIQAKLTTMVDRVTTTVGGPQSLVEILNRGDRSTERVILQSLASEQPEL
ncbi:MAG TPA: flagellar motor switch protein FliG, partial [Armatimonadota bacterium]